MSSNQPSPADLIAIIQAHGSDATTLRDAAHEAHHAIAAGVPAGRWDRETIHRAVLRMRPGDAARSEIRARAVEQLVCARFGVDAGPVETWALTAMMEAIKSRVPFFSDHAMVVDLIKRAMASKEGERMADAVMGLRMPVVRKASRRAAKRGTETV